MIISSYGKFKRFNLVVYGFNCELNSVFEFLINLEFDLIVYF